MIIVVIILIIVLLVILIGWIVMRQPQFGKAPSGERLKRIEASPNYKDGTFQNLSPTPSLAEDVTFFSVLRQFFFERSKRNRPAAPIPSVKTDLHNLDPDQDLLVWFGHSSYFMQLSGRRILVDPVFSGHASPFTFTTKSFEGANVYSAADMPGIDYLFLTHDHYDHLDYETIIALQPKIKKAITALGVGEHLEYWGYDKSIIIEKDWNEQVTLEDGFTVNTAPTRHFAGRKLKRNISLWTSFIFTTPSRKIYIGGDSGYDTHFAAIGNQYGPFDLAILENGQYNHSWKYIHMMPEEVVQAAIDLKAKRLLPVHWAKFALALHAWDDSIIRVTKEAGLKNVPLIHPMIGEVVNLDNPQPSTRWWESVK